MGAWAEGTSGPVSVVRTAARSGACAAVLSDGSVLLTGGVTAEGAIVANAELFSARAGSSETTPMLTPRSGHSCATLADGRVLVAGGTTAGSGATDSVEVFDPGTRSWQHAGPLPEPRSDATATLLRSGRVLIAGGTVGGAPSATLLAYDPLTGVFAPSNSRLSSPRSRHAAAALKNGRVLIAGGWDGEKALESVDAYDPVTDSVAAFGSLSTPRAGLTATALLDGRIYFAGGSSGAEDLASAESYDPGANAYAAAAPMSGPRAGHAAARIAGNNGILLTGGKAQSLTMAATELYIPWWNSYTTVSNQLPAASAPATTIRRAGTPSAGLPVVATDKEDYYPGEIVTITGDNWPAGRNVTLLLQRQPQTEGTLADTTLKADANDTGHFTVEYVVQPEDLGKTYTLTSWVTDTPSITAQIVTFTDSPKVVSVTLGPQMPAQVTAGGAATFQVTVTRGPGNDSFGAALSASGLPAGATAAFSPSTLTFTGTDAALASTLTITTASSLVPGSHSFTVTAARSQNDSASAAGSLVSVADTTPPVITADVSGTVGANGWYTSNVTVSWTVTDPESSVTSTTGCGATTLSTDTASIVYTCSATSAGGTSTQSVTVKRDATAPTLTFGPPSPSANAQGWNNSDVTFTYTASDATSGLAGDAAGSVVITSEGPAATGSVTIADNAGNSKVFTTPAVKIDRTAPSLTATRAPEANTFGWNNSDVTVTFACTDTGSGLAAGSPPSPTTLAGEGAGQSASGTCTDLAGNSASATISGISIDKTKPVASAAAAPAPNAAGWNNTDVTVTFTGTDDLSGIDGCDSAVILTNDGANQSAAGVCRDRAGNVSDPASRSGIKIDKTAPTLTFGAQSPAANAAGWNNTDVSFAFTTADNLSGVASTSAASPLVLTSEGTGLTRSVTVVDNAGNSKMFTTPAVNIDKTPPVISVGAPSQGAQYMYSQAVTPAYSCPDALSGTASCSGPAVVDTLTLGAHTYTVNATDRAGNTAAATVGYSVVPITSSLTVSPSPATLQYSDQVTLTATILPALTPVPLTGTVTFAIGSQTVAANVPLQFVSGAYIATATIELKAAYFAPSATAYPASAAFTSASPYYSNASGSGSGVSVTQEDARVTYAGVLFASTASVSSGQAIVALSATVRDISAVAGDPGYDAFAGDIANAKVTFVNRDAGSAPLGACKDLTVGLVNAGDAQVGSVTCNWPVDLGGADSSSFTVGIVVGGHYVRNASEDDVVITVSRPLGTDFITGGGHLVLSDSAGLYAGAAGSKNNFGFNVKYNKKGTSLQGQVNTIIRLNGRVYQVKSNSITSLTVHAAGANNPAATAVFTGKANIQDITNPLSPQPIDGNATLQATMTDQGEPGAADGISITVWNKGGGLWFTSNWDGTKPVEQVLAGGNLVVH